MKLFWRAAALAATIASAGPAFVQESGAAANGRWDAVLSRNGVDIPFRLDIKGDGPTLQGVLYDGWYAYDGTTSATFKDGQLALNVDHYLTTINASLKDGKLAGTPSRRTARQARSICSRPCDMSSRSPQQ